MGEAPSGRHRHDLDGDNRRPPSYSVGGPVAGTSWSQAAAFIRREPTICLELPYQHSNANARHTPVLISTTSLVTARSHRLWQRQLGFVRIRYVVWAHIINASPKLTLFCRTFLRPPSIDASPEQLPYCWQYATQNLSFWANGTPVSGYYFKPKNYI